MSHAEDLAELKKRRTERLQQLASISSKMKGDHLIFANNLLEGMNASEAFRKIKPRNQNDQYAKTRGPALARREDVKAYVELMKKEAVDTAMNRVQFNEEDWLRTQLEIQAKALGQTKVKKAFLFNGEVIEDDVFEDNLTQANKTQELLGKRFGLLTDKVETSRTTLKLKDMTGRKKKTPK